MTAKKISQLTAHTTPVDADVLPVVTSGSTKKITYSRFKSNIRSFLGNYGPSSVIAFCGDSTTDEDGGRGFIPAVSKEWLSAGGHFEGAEIHDLGGNGTMLSQWVATIATGNSSTPTTLKTEAWAIVNLDPDLIVVCLGINDVLDASRRAVQGVEATMQANLNTLIQFYLDYSNADVFLRPPRTLVDPTGMAESFSTGWANADEVATYSAQIRRIYFNCSNANNPRVRIWDPLDLYPARMDDITDAVDEETGDNLMADDVHQSFIGMRREVQEMGDRITGHSTKQYTPIVASNADAIYDGLWSETLYLNSVTVLGSGSSICGFEMDPLARVDLPINTKNDYTRTVARHATPHMQALRALSQYGGCRRLLQAGLQGSDIAAIYAYCHASGNVYSFGKASLSQIVDAADPVYMQIIFDYHKNQAHTENADWSADDIGPVTFWVEDMKYAPYLTKNRQKETLRFFLNTGAGWNEAAPVKIYPNSMYKFQEDWRSVTIKGWCYKAPSGGSCTAQWTVDNVDKCPSGILFADGANNAVIADLAAFNISSGAVMYLAVTLNPGNAGDICIEVEGYRTLF